MDPIPRKVNTLSKICVKFQGVTVHLEAIYGFFKIQGPLRLRTPGLVECKTFLGGGEDNSTGNQKTKTGDDTESCKEYSTGTKIPYRKSDYWYSNLGSTTY